VRYIVSLASRVLGGSIREVNVVEVWEQNVCDGSFECAVKCCVRCVRCVAQRLTATWSNARANAKVLLSGRGAVVSHLFLIIDYRESQRL
jgi:hypothetical protein